MPSSSVACLEVRSCVLAGVVMRVGKQDEALA